jgi:hypothetical protein
MNIDEQIKNKMEENKISFNPNDVYLETSLPILGINLKCYVLKDGRRMIGADSMEDFVNAMKQPNIELKESEMVELAKFIKGNNL